MTQYRDIVIETYQAHGESSSRAIRARPLAGQGLSTGLKVECPTRMRNAYPVGTKLLIRAKVTEAYGVTFLYTYYGWSYQVLSALEAREHIEKNNPPQ